MNKDLNVGKKRERRGIRRKLGMKEIDVES
jgi:hypothetical protein